MKKKPGRPKGSGKKLQSTINFCLAYPDMTGAEIARKLNVGINTVARARKAITLRGEQGKSPTNPSNPGLTTESTTDLIPQLPPKAASKSQAEALTQEFDELQRNLEDPTTYDSPKMRKHLVNLLKRAQVDLASKLEIDVIKAIQDLDKRNIGETSLGPGPPKTEEEWIDRTSVILDCAMPKIAAQAALRAFKGPDLQLFMAELERLKPTSHQLHSTQTELAGTTVIEPPPPPPPITPGPDTASEL
jgi:hypothetical protein